MNDMSYNPISSTKKRPVNKKRRSFTSMLMYLLVLAMAVPYFTSNKTKDALGYIGSTPITRHGLIIDQLISQITQAPMTYPYLQYHGQYFNNYLHKSFPFSNGLTAHPQQIDSVIKKINNYINYDQLLKNLQLTDQHFRKYIQENLIGLQMHSLIDQLAKQLMTFSSFVDKLEQIYKQKRHGQVQFIALERYEPTFSGNELIELEQFFVTQNFKSPIKGHLIGLRIDNESTFKNIINDFQQNLSIENIASKHNLETFTIDINGDQMNWSSVMSLNNLKPQLYQALNNNSINIPFILTDNNQKIIFVIKNKTLSVDYEQKYFDTHILPSWKNKDQTQKVIAAWINEKSMAKTISAVNAMIDKKSGIINQMIHLNIIDDVIFSATANNILSIDKVNNDLANNNSAQFNQLNQKEQIKLQKVLFELKPGQYKTLAIGGKVALVHLKKIDKVNEQTDIRANIKKMLVNQLHQEWIQTITTTYR